MRFDIEFYGHKNIRSLHPRTIEITKETNLTPSGDCIIGVNASNACNDLPDSLKEKLRDPNSKITITITIGTKSFTVKGTGNAGLELSHPSDIVIRTSNFVCPRTLAINCNNASDSIPRNFVQLLQDPTTKGVFSIVVD